MISVSDTFRCFRLYTLQPIYHTISIGGSRQLRKPHWWNRNTRAHDAGETGHFVGAEGRLSETDLQGKKQTLR